MLPSQRPSGRRLGPPFGPPRRPHRAHRAPRAGVALVQAPRASVRVPAGLLRACSAMCGMAVLLLGLWAMFDAPSTPSGAPATALGALVVGAATQGRTGGGLGTWLGLLVIGLSMPVLLVLGGRDDARLRWTFTGAALSVGMLALVLWLAAGR